MHLRPWGLGIKSRDTAWDPVRRTWTMPRLLGELDGPTSLGEIFPEGISPTETLEWSGQGDGTYLDLKERIISAQQYNVPSDNMMLTSGTNHANFVAMLTHLERGDEVIVPRPAWPQFTILAEGIGCKFKVLDLKEEHGWHWDIEELNNAVTKRTRMICVCNPNNPTGTRITQAEVRAITEIAKSAGAIILSDECFRWFEWDGQTTPSWVNNYEKAISTSSTSKAISGDGLRIGWMVSQDKELVKSCDAIRKHSSEFVNYFGAKIAWAAFEADRFKMIIGKKRENGYRNFIAVSEWMKKNQHFKWVPPDAGFLSFPKYDMDILSSPLCNELLQKYQVILGPGLPYDKEYHVRFGFGRTNLEDLKEGLNRLDNFLADYEKGKVVIAAS